MAGSKSWNALPQTIMGELSSQRLLWFRGGPTPPPLRNLVWPLKMVSKLNNYHQLAIIFCQLCNHIELALVCAQQYKISFYFWHFGHSSSGCGRCKDNEATPCSLLVWNFLFVCMTTDHSVLSQTFHYYTTEVILSCVIYMLSPVFPVFMIIYKAVYYRRGHIIEM